MIALCKKTILSHLNTFYGFNISLEGTSYFVLLDDGRQLIQDQQYSELYQIITS